MNNNLHNYFSHTKYNNKCFSKNYFITPNNNNKLSIPIAKTKHSSHINNKIDKNSQSFADLNENSKISSSLSSIIYPKALDNIYTESKERRKSISNCEIRNKSKEKRHKKHRKNATDDFDTILNTIEKVVLKNDNNTYNNNSLKMKHHHSLSCSSEKSNKRNEKSCEEELLLKVKKALILNSSDIDSGNANTAIENLNDNKNCTKNDTIKTKDKNSLSNENQDINEYKSTNTGIDENNQSNYSRILLNSISEIPSFNEEKINSSNKHTPSKSYLSDNYDRSENKNSKIKKRNLATSKLFILNKDIMDDNECNYSNGSQKESDHKLKIKEKEQIKFSKDTFEKSISYSNLNKNSNNLDKDKLQEYLIYENQQLKRRLHELENNYEYLHSHNEDNIKSNKNFNHNINKKSIEGNDGNINNNDTSNNKINNNNNESNNIYFIPYDSSKLSAYNKNCHINIIDMDKENINLNLNLNNCVKNGSQEYEIENDKFNNISFPERYSKNKSNREKSSKQKNKENATNNNFDSKNCNIYQHNAKNIYEFCSNTTIDSKMDIDINNNNNINLSNENMSSCGINETQNLSSFDSFSINNIPKIEYNTIIDDTDETMFDKLFVPIIEKYIDTSQPLYLNNDMNSSNIDININNSNNKTLNSNFEYVNDNKISITCCNNYDNKEEPTIKNRSINSTNLLLNNISDLSYSDFSFDSKKYLINHGLLDKR